MTLTKLKNSHAGFSLIELMVVVAIIAILATVAIPQYQAFQAKSRRSEGKMLLQSYFTAAHATFAELGHFPGNFVSTGFAPTGQVHARITVADNATAVPEGTPHDAACIVTSAACALIITWSEVNTGTWRVAAPAGAAGAVGDATFLAVSSSLIDTTGTTNDTWSLNHLKVFDNTSNGLE